jgi:hypothetical protein
MAQAGLYMEEWKDSARAIPFVTRIPSISYNYVCGKDDNSSELGKRNEVIVELPVARETTPSA